MNTAISPQIVGRPVTLMAGLLSPPASPDVLAKRRPAGFNLVSHTVRRPACATDASGPAARNGLSITTIQDGDVRNNQAVEGRPAENTCAAGSPLRTESDYKQAKLAARKQVMERGKDDCQHTTGGCCFVTFLVGVILIAILCSAVIASACPNPSHQTPTGEIVLEADMQPRVIAIVPLPPDGFDAELRDQLQAFVKANGHHQFTGTKLSNEEAETVADACMLWPDPRWACAMCLAESSGDTNAVNVDSGARGWWQLLGHKRSMAKLGLDICNEADRTTYAIEHLHGPKQRKGPWAASKSGTAKWLRLLNQYIKSEKEGDGNGE